MTAESEQTPATDVSGVVSSSPDSDAVTQDEAVVQTETDLSIIDEETLEQVDKKSRVRKALEIFLKLFGVLMLIVLVSLIPDKNGEMAGVNILTEAIIRIQMIESQEEALVLEQRFQEITGTTENPHYESHAQIIADAIAAFEAAHPDIEVTFPASRYSDAQITQVLMSVIAENWDQSESFEEFISRTFGVDMINDFMGASPDDANTFFYYSQSSFAALPGSYFDRIGEGHMGRARDEAIEAEHNRIKAEFEALRQDQGELLSQSQVLLYFLERNDGNLLLALNDMSTFYKWVIRDSILQQDIQWYFDNILDQTNRNFSLNSFPQFSDLERNDWDGDADIVLSVVGLEYHSWGIIMFLSLGNPSLAQQATLGEYLKYEHVAEAYKLLTDFDLLLQLDELPLPVSE